MLLTTRRNGLSNDFSLTLDALKATLADELFLHTSEYKTPRSISKKTNEDKDENNTTTASTVCDAFARQDSTNTSSSESECMIPYGVKDHQAKAYESLEKYDETPFECSSNSLKRQTFTDWRPNPSKLIEIKKNVKELKATLEELKQSRATSKHKQSKKKLSLR